MPFYYCILLYLSEVSYSTLCIYDFFTAIHHVKNVLIYYEYYYHYHFIYIHRNYFITRKFKYINSMLGVKPGCEYKYRMYVQNYFYRDLFYLHLGGGLGLLNNEMI